MWNAKQGLLLVVFLTAGCRRDMQDQPKYKPLAKSSFFADGRSARPLVAGTIPYGELNEDVAFYQGTRDGAVVDTIPISISHDLLVRGQERYEIYCAPCHGSVGYGDGMIGRHGFRAPPSLHSARSRALPPGYVFGVITNGYGAMPNYDIQIPVRDRWAIIAYVRVLQFSRNVSISDVPPEERTKLDAGGQP